MTDVDLRASDDDRQATVDRLAAHFQAGRLDAGELEERSAAAHAARTRGELAALEADLPAADGASAPRARRLLDALSRLTKDGPPGPPAPPRPRGPRPPRPPGR